MKKTAGVYTNDINRPRQDLVISGLVENFANIHPKHVSLRGLPGDSIEGTVTIIPGKKYPFKILEFQAQKGIDINIELEKVKKSGKAAYKLKVKNIRQKPGRYYDMIVMKTDSKVKPLLIVKVYGNLKSPKSD